MVIYLKRINLHDYNIILHLVRHGEDEQDKIGGWSDNHLTNKGIEEVKALLPLIDSSYDLFISSDLVRAKETSKILNTKLNMDIIYDSNYRECNNGIYKNKLKSELNEIGVKRFKEMPMNEKFPGGESPIMFYKRVKKAFLKLLDENRNKKILLVSHGGIITIIMCLLEGIEYTNTLRIHPKTGTLTIFK